MNYKHIRTLGRMLVGGLIAATILSVTSCLNPGKELNRLISSFKETEDVDAKMKELKELIEAEVLKAVRNRFC